MLYHLFDLVMLLALQVVADRYCSPYTPPSGTAPSCPPFILPTNEMTNLHRSLLEDDVHRSTLAERKHCPRVHIIGIRGTKENQGPGFQSCIIDQVLGNFKGADACGLVYPADGLTINPPPSLPTANFTEYKASQQTGVDNLGAHLMKYTSRCPNTKIALMGYSQGAHVVGDVLCGRASPSPFKLPQPPLHKQYTKNIVAILQFGDPNNNPNPRPVALPWHQGTSTTAGTFPRNSIEDCLYLNGKWQSYCDEGDPYCASGTNFTLHLQYPNKYNDMILKFIKRKLPKPGCE